MKSDDNELILREERIVETIAQLHLRISDRFPESGLAKLCGKLLRVSRQAAERSAWISNPILWVRVLGYSVAVILVLFFAAAVAYGLRASETEEIGFFDLVQAIDSGLNELILFAVAVFFLINLETRIKRQRALKAIHELRSIAHVIDMHQLTKDPERVLGDWSATKNSPKLSMTPMELSRYLDYCGEMLSLVGKVASLYVQCFDDEAAVAAVSEVEQLTTGLSRKILQKIMILSLAREQAASMNAASINTASKNTSSNSIEAATVPSSRQSEPSTNPEDRS